MTDEASKTSRRGMLGTAAVSAGMVLGLTGVCDQSEAAQTRP